MSMTFRRALALLLAAFPTCAQADTRILDLGPAQVLVATPAHPRAAIVMFPGGTGRVDFDHDASFTIRTIGQWNARGDAVLVPGALHGENERGHRLAPAFARWTATLVATAHAQVPGVPVFLLGTSQGTIAAMAGAAGPDVAGLVLTESVTEPGRRSAETVFDAHPASVRVPALVVANANDRCPVAPPEDAPRIAARMTGSPHVDILRLDGGEQRSADPCSSRTPHGEWGIAPRVVDAIGRWIDARR